MKPQINVKWMSLFALAMLIGLLGPGAVPQVAAQSPIEANDACLVCHSNPDLSITFADGNEVVAHVSGNIYQNSVHGQEQMTCAGCHPGHDAYPHPEMTASSRRAYSFELNQQCLQCHPDQAERVSDSVHAQVIAGGRMEAALCVDCHGAHDTVSLRQSRVKIALACRQCHTAIYDEYSQSVHGTALSEEDNQDVPTCVDCHGVHTIQDPRTARFRLDSPDLCGSCHADEALMNKYDISTDVFQTYVADFHGTTVTLFERQSPDAPTNKAVCYDCHTAHAIRAHDDPSGSTVKENLLTTCRKCHPDATDDFPDSWTSHFPPTFERQPLVAVVNLFYAIVIPATLGFMGLFVVIDASRRIVNRVKKTDHPTGTEE